jgi:5-methylcytosine-specific restriction endonuclease McrA
MTGKKHKNAFLDPQATWYKLQRWCRRARLQLAAEPLCAYCLERGRTVPARVADHVEPVNGNWNAMWLGRLQSLCKSCHDGAKRTEERNGFRPGFGVDGLPLDSKHPAYQPRRWAR